MASYVGAIDQGTTSTRFIVFDQSGGIVTTAQKEHQQIYPQPGSVEHDAEEIWQRTVEVITTAIQQAGLRPEDQFDGRVVRAMRSCGQDAPRSTSGFSQR
jgi:glycerol kinase